MKHKGKGVPSDQCLGQSRMNKYKSKDNIMINKRNVIIKLKGGLGYQMFQYAFGVALKKEIIVL